MAARDRKGVFAGVVGASREQAALAEPPPGELEDNVEELHAERAAPKAKFEPEPAKEGGEVDGSGSAMAELAALRSRGAGQRITVHGVALTMTPEEQLQIVGTTVNMPKPLREAIRVGQQLTGKTFQEFACWAMGLALEQLEGSDAIG